MGSPTLVTLLLLGLLSLPPDVGASPLAYVLSQQDDSIAVIDTATNAVTDTITNTGTFPRGIAVNPSGTRLYVTYIGFQQGIRVIDTATHAIVKNIQLFFPPYATPDYPVLNPTAPRLYVAAYCRIAVGVLPDRGAGHDHQHSPRTLRDRSASDIRALRRPRVPRHLAGRHAPLRHDVDRRLQGDRHQQRHHPDDDPGDGEPRPGRASFG
jgi:YVTN family beta-propeller protein